MWEIATIFGLSFVPCYLNYLGSESENNIFKSFIFIFNLFLVAMVLRTTKLIATLNDVSVSSAVNIVYVAYLYGAGFLILVFLVNLIRDLISKENAD